MAGAGFGATTDVWSFADTNVILQASQPAMKTGSLAQAEDSKGSVTEETSYDTGSTASATYRVNKGGTVSFSAVMLGKVVAGKVVTSIDVSRSNKDDLQVVIAGENCPSADSMVEKVTPVFDSAFLAGGKNAVAAGIVISKGKVISSSIKCSVQVVKGLSALGAQVIKDVYKGRMEATNEVQSCDTAPAAVADTANGWHLAPAGGASQTNTAYGTTTFEAYKNLALDT